MWDAMLLTGDGTEIDRHWLRALGRLQIWHYGFAPAKRGSLTCSLYTKSPHPHPHPQSYYYYYYYYYWYW
jgi:hypothetical protein